MRVAKWLVFIVYVLVMTKFILLKHIPSQNIWQMVDMSQIAFRWQSANLIPFRTIELYLAPSPLNPAIRMQNLAGNVLLFIPFGVLLPLLIHRFHSIIRTTVGSAAFSLFYEVVQLLFGFGSFDVDDVLLNTIGGMIGYGLFYAWRIAGRSQK